MIILDILIKMVSYFFKFYNWTIYLIQKWIAKLYEFYVNVFLYFKPFEIKIPFDLTKNMIISESKYKNSKKSISDNYCFINKIHDVSYKNYRFYNFGYYYHILDNYDQKHFNSLKSDLKYAFAPEPIKSVTIVLKDKTFVLKDNSQNRIFFDILNHSTETVILSIIIYYYLQKYLNNNDIINNVSMEIDNNNYIIDHNKTLKEIYDEIDDKL